VTDLRLAPAGETLDLVLEAGDLALDVGLVTPALLSVYTDGLAEADDEVPDGSGDRRGWWAAGLLETDGTAPFGSRLWTMERSKLTEPTLASLEERAREAVQWMVERGIAERSEASATRLDLRAAAVDLRLHRGDADERAELWDAPASALVVLGPARLSILAVP